MGAGNSQQTEYEAACSVFNDTEHELIKGIFKDCGDDERTVIEFKFQAYLKRKLPSAVVKRLYDATCLLLDDNHANMSVGFDLQNFTIMLAYALKGTIDQKSHLLVCLSKRNSKSKEITFDELSEAVKHLLSAYMTMMTETAQYKSWKIEYESDADDRMVKFLLQDICKDEPLTVLSVDEVERWLSKSAFINHMLLYIFYKCFPVNMEDETSEFGPTIPKIPVCRLVDWSACRSLLDLSSLVFLNHSIPVEHARQWRLLFNSRTHGESFSTMCKHIVGKGPSLVVIRDTAGHVFGGFASESWTPKSNFYGSMSCFLFTLSPEVGRFYPTGVNQNFIYLNNGQQTLPNGLGFGGQFGYFGLWLDSEYGQGQSRAEPKCSTYMSPRLSAEEHFQFESLEIWGVGEFGAENTDSKHSILDEDPGAKALLSLIGKGPVSEGLRETDPTAQSPEEHKLPPM